MDFEAWSMHSDDSLPWNTSIENTFWPPCSQQTFPDLNAAFDSRKNAPKKIRQRSAANQRERKRMRTINDAFDGLRCRIPDAKEDAKISKVDTLRMAISYINQLSDVLKTCESSGSDATQNKSSQRKETVLIRYHNNDDLMLPPCTSYPAPVTSQEPGFPLYGHTLSWNDEQEGPGCPGPDQRLSAKIWIPEQASLEDIANL